MTKFWRRDEICIDETFCRLKLFSMICKCAQYAIKVKFKVRLFGFLFTFLVLKWHLFSGSWGKLGNNCFFTHQIRIRPILYAIQHLHYKHWSYRSHNHAFHDFKEPFILPLKVTYWAIDGRNGVSWRHLLHVVHDIVTY